MQVVEGLVGVITVYWYRPRCVSSSFFGQDLQDLEREQRKAQEQQAQRQLEIQSLQDIATRADLVVQEYEEKMEAAAVFMSALQAGASPAGLLLQAHRNKKE